MKKSKQKNSEGTSAAFVLFGLICLGLLVAVLLSGKDIALFNPKGVIAQEQYSLMLYSMAIMLLIAVPAVALLYYFGWKYRETNTKSMYSPNMRQGKLFEFGLWAIPSFFMIVLAFIMIPATHRLEPQKAIASDNEEITIQVIALRWKWLFVYPEQNIASVNFVQIPVDTPVRFELTADETPKSSFWVPHLGGQLYAMTGHVNPLYLMAEDVGDYPGSSAEINGAGYAGMKFTARATTEADFNKWVRDTQKSSNLLDPAEYENLLIPSERNSFATYSLDYPDLYAKMLMKYAGSHSHQPQIYHTEH